MAGNFENLPLIEMEKEMLTDMYRTITILGLWEWLEDPDIPGKNGFVFAEYPELDKITKTIEYKQHSGASFAYTLRVIEKIAKKGWATYVKDLLATSTCRCMREKNLVGWCGVAGMGVPACDH